MDRLRSSRPDPNRSSVSTPRAGGWPRRCAGRRGSWSATRRPASRSARPRPGPGSQHAGSAAAEAAVAAPSVSPRPPARTAGAARVPVPAPCRRSVRKPVPRCSPHRDPEVSPQCWHLIDSPESGQLLPSSATIPEMPIPAAISLPTICGVALRSGPGCANPPVSSTGGSPGPVSASRAAAGTAARPSVRPPSSARPPRDHRR